MTEGYYTKETVMPMLVLTFNMGFHQGTMALKQAIKENPKDLERFLDDFRDKERTEYVKSIQRG